MNGFMKRHQSRGFTLLGMLMALVAAGILVVGMTGCDEETTASKIEDARIAIDDGDYEKALGLLLSEAETREVLDIRSSAYAGQVGIDTFAILAELDSGDDEGAEEKNGIDLIGKMLGAGAANTIACFDIAIKLSDLDMAVTAIIRSVGGDAASLDDNGKVKLGIYGFTDFVLVTGHIFCRNYPNDLSPSSTVIMTKSGIDELKGKVDSFTGIQVEDSEFTKIAQDIGYMKGAISELGEGNDLAEEFDSFLDDIDPDANGIILQSEFEEFLNRL